MDSTDQQDHPPRIRNIIALGILVIAVGVVFYHIVENLSWVDAIYFSVITLMTIGYGDITPQTEIGKIFTTVYVLIGIGILAGIVNYLIKRAAIEKIAHRHKKNHHKE